MEKRAVIYIRVSDQSQIENNSLEVQEKACRNYAKQKGYAVHEPIFKDEGFSAKHVDTRPDMKNLLLFCCNKKNNISYVIVYKMDRWSRNAEEGLAAAALLAKYGVELISTTEGIEKTPSGSLLKTILLALGQFDNEMKGERVHDNMIALFRKGIWHSRCPVGYKRPFNTKEENKGKPPIKIPELEEIIIQLFQRAAKGIYSRQKLADYMNNKGFREYAGSKSTAKIVERIVKNSFYFGNMYSKKWNEFSWGKHEPMIDEDTWCRANLALFGSNRKYKIQDNSLFPLKGLLKCEICSHEMTSSNPRGRSKQYLHYECGNKACRGLRIDAEKAHDKFMNLLYGIKPTSRVLKLFIHMIFSEWDSTINITRQEIIKIDQQIEQYKNDLRVVSRSLDKRIYTEEMAQGEADKINLELTILEVSRSDIKIEQYDAEKIKNFTEHFLSNLDSLWLRLEDLSMKQALQKKIFPEGVILTRNHEIRTATLSPAFALISTLSDGNLTFGDPEGIRTPDSQDENLMS